MKYQSSSKVTLSNVDIISGKKYANYDPIDISSTIEINSVTIPSTKLQTLIALKDLESHVKTSECADN